MLIRLIGVRFSNLVHGNHQIDLFQDTTESINLYDRIDYIKHRFGTDKLMRASTLNIDKRVKMNMNAFKG
jgi:DNA polymerase-4